MSDLGYLRFLPAFYTNSQYGLDGSKFLTEYLRVFEALFSGVQPNPLYNIKGIDQLLDEEVLGNLFYPRFSFLFPGSTAFMPSIEPDSSGPSNPNALPTTPPLEKFNQYIGVAKNDKEIQTRFVPWLEDFLRWLGGWIALSMDFDWSLDQKRTYIASAMPLYRSRGTVATLNALLYTWAGDALSKLWSNGNLQISFPSTYYLGVGIALQVSDGVAVGDTTTMSPYYPPLVPFSVGTSLNNGFNTQTPIVGGARPGYFFASLYLPNYLNPSGQWSIKDLRNLELIIQKVVAQLQPAGSYFQLNVYPTLQVGNANLGNNTILAQVPPYSTSSYQAGVSATLGVNTNVN